MRAALSKIFHRRQSRALFAWRQTRERLAKFSFMLLRKAFAVMRNSFRSWRIQAELLLQSPKYAEMLQAVARRMGIRGMARLLRDWQAHCRSLTHLESTAKACALRWNRHIKRSAVKIWARYARKQIQKRELDFSYVLNLTGACLRAWFLHVRFCAMRRLSRAAFYRRQVLRNTRAVLNAWQDLVLDFRMLVRSENQLRQRHCRIASNALRSWHGQQLASRRLLQISRLVHRRNVRALLSKVLVSWMQRSNDSWERWRRIEGHRSRQGVRVTVWSLAKWREVVRRAALRRGELLRVAHTRMCGKSVRTWRAAVRTSWSHRCALLKIVFRQNRRLAARIFGEWDSLVSELFDKRMGLERLRASVAARSSRSLSGKALLEWRRLCTTGRRMKLCAKLLACREAKHAMRSVFSQWYWICVLHSRLRRCARALWERRDAAVQGAYLSLWAAHLRFEKQLVRHVHSWNLRDRRAAFTAWAGVVQDHIRDNSRHVVLASRRRSDLYVMQRRFRTWNYVVDLRGSIRLRVGLARIKCMQRVLAQRRVLQALSERARARSEAAQAEQLLARRVWRMRCQRAAMAIRRHAVCSKQRRKAVWLMATRLDVRVLRRGWLVWITWMNHKKRTQQALQDVMDDF